MTIYVLGFAVGPLLFAPLSEVYGRVVIYRSCLALFMCFTVVCALSSSIGMLVAFRFIAGCFGAAPVAIGGAMVYDLFEVKERGLAMAIYHSGPIFGNLLGPPLGGFIIQHQSWRWVFWIITIFAGFALLSSFFILRETHAPTILCRRKADGGPRGFTPNHTNPDLVDDISQEIQTPEMRQAIRSPTTSRFGSSDAHVPDVVKAGPATLPVIKTPLKSDIGNPSLTKPESADKAIRAAKRPLTPDIDTPNPRAPDPDFEVLGAIKRPLKLLLFSPIILACSLIISIVAGTMNLIFASLGRIFQDEYGFSTSASGLMYLGVTTGFLFAAFVFGRTSDGISQFLMKRNDGKRQAEYRLPAMMIGLPLVVIGLFWYGWSARYHAFWLAPMLGLYFFGMGVTTIQVSDPRASANILPVY
ncbi:hypothetical protein AYO21_08853 [Fonsecaea monophora]|uniref:Major facilitator superfamily (MFS) profile domain-containing protein n=1 Tax=Fonsecaea monophora TaxID=254056 RepID=A0A177F0R2_9EURO|nr:hypothetical protein AYO21_08853 [Fonsecaea monophora]KAH0827681.1 hypothetical protein FOPE_00137 [Fonsecaea pedrosoi]OAG36892.1 hypothetical protein AYO21_08853 [Fonsecaea monophora]